VNTLDNLLRHLASLSPEPFDCIVHVGSGAGADPADYSTLSPEHAVLIEADPEAHAALAERFKADPRVTVIQALVAPQNADTSFNRFTLPSLNAPLGLGRLRELYPRIDLVEELRIKSQTLHQLVGEDVLRDRNLLVLDIPGQEAALLRALPSDFLRRFSIMAVLTSTESWLEGAEPLGTTLAILKEKQFELAREISTDPAWPVILVQRDEAKVRLEEELDRNAGLLSSRAAQIKQQSEQIAILTSERDALATRLAALESQHADLANLHSSVQKEHEELQFNHTSLASLHSALAAERDTLSNRLASLETEVKGKMQQELDQRAQLLVAKATQIEQQTVQVAALSSECEALTARISSLEAERHGLATRHTSLETEHSDLVTRHSSLVTAFEELQSQHSSLAAERAALHSDLSTKSTLLEVLSKGRIAQDEQVEKLLQERKTLISDRDALASRASALVSQVEKLEARGKLIDEEFGKAEGQIELIKDIFLREAIR